MRPITLALLLAVSLSSGAAPAPAALNAQRLFLLGASTDDSAWYGLDASDPELSADTISCSSGADYDGRGCPLEPNGSLYAWFLPRLVLRQQVIWDATSPLRFHVEVSAQDAQVQEVRLLLDHGGAASTSPAATQIAPGVFEGTMRLGSPLDPALVAPFGVKVTLTGIASSISIRAGGASWVDLPTPVSADGIPELIAGDTYRPEPATVAIGERTFTFNDGNHQTWTFDSTLVGTRAHAIVLPTTASAVIAWVESFSEPFVHDALNGGSPDERKLVQYPRLRLLSGATQLDARERGVAAPSVPAGPLTIEVIRRNFHSSTGALVEGVPYRLHVVAAFGERTLAAMRWPLPQARWTTVRTPVVAECPYDTESIAQPARAPTFALGLSWTGPAADTQRWTFSFDLPGNGFYPCDEAYTGSTLRLSLPGPRLWAFSPTPAVGGTNAAVQDTRFEMTVRYTYESP